MSLASPRISIQALKPGKPVLTIVVHNRRPNLFTSEIKNHEFKCLSEGDMIEWMASLQQTIQYFLLTRTLIPNGPPEPLFKSPQAIEENVQSLINDSNSLLVKNYPRKSLANEQHSTETLQDNEESIPTQSLSRKATSPEQEISSDYLNKTAEILEPMLQEAQ
jgi:hypothetical protein